MPTASSFLSREEFDADGTIPVEAGRNLNVEIMLSLYLNCWCRIALRGWDGLETVLKMADAQAVQALGPQKYQS